MPKNIKQKLKKIYTMAKRGTIHERKVAQQLLDKLLLEYDVTLDELKSEEKKWYGFTFGTKYEKDLLFQIVAHVLQIGTITFRKTGNTRRLLFEMTPLQYHTVSDYWATYRTPLKLEIERYAKSLFSAYIQKHNLFGTGSSDGNDKEDTTDVDLMFALMKSLRDIARPVKQIEGE